MKGKKFQYPIKITDLIIHELEALADNVMPEERITVIEKDAKENRAMECAQESQAHFIVSEEVHLLEIENFKGTKILTPKEFFLTITE